MLSLSVSAKFFKPQFFGLVLIVCHYWFQRQVMTSYVTKVQTGQNGIQVRKMKCKGKQSQTKKQANKNNNNKIVMRYFFLDDLSIEICLHNRIGGSVNVPAGNSVTWRGQGALQQWVVVVQPLTALWGVCVFTCSSYSCALETRLLFFFFPVFFTASGAALQSEVT